MENKKVIIVGAGPGGLSAGMLLAARGYSVKIFEKKPYIGGRNSAIKLGEYTFDMGPTFFMMKDVLTNIFIRTGRNIENYINLVEVDPLYGLYYGDGKTFFPSRYREKMVKEMNKVFPGNQEGYFEYLKKEEEKYAKLMACLKIPYGKLTDLLKKPFVTSIPYLDLNISLFDVLGKYFKDKDLKISFTFQAKYIGMSPWQAPGTFSIISYIEHGGGVYHITGGLNQLSHGMAAVLLEENGEIITNTEVKDIIVKDGKALGVELKNGKKEYADHIIINADFAHAMKSIVKKENRKKYTDEKLKKMKYSVSTFMMYLGVKKEYDLPHNSIFFAKDYEANVKDIVEKKIISEDFSFYIQNACKSDKTLAPEGKSTIYVLVPVPNNTSNIDWKKEKSILREKLLKALETRAGLKDIRENIEEEKIITPLDWENEIDVYNGATFNLGHNIGQMLYFRPHNEFEEFENCYLVGGGTHPGSGLPTIYESGRISADIIIKKDGKKKI